MLSFFHGLRGKLTLTYTLVTVLALMALEVLVIAVILLISSLTRVDQQQYLSDVIYTLYPQASAHLQPGAVDLDGLQTWLEEVYRSGYASVEPLSAFDSPAAKIVPEDPMLVLAPDGVVLAQAPREAGSLIGRKYVPSSDPGSEHILQQARAKNFTPLGLSTTTSDGKIRLAVPVTRGNTDSDLVGIILLTVEPPPPQILRNWPVYLGWVLATGLMLLCAVAPFGALFGFIMSRGLTRRLKTLTQAADAWSEGDFSPRPLDHSKDEIGALSARLHHMAERLETLIQTQQELAALEERNHLARELHDTVKQQTFATMMQVRAARNLLEKDPQSARDHLEQAEELIRTSQQELSRMITEMRPPALEGQGLSAALEGYSRTWSQHTRIPVDFKVASERRLPLENEQALFRVAQEALSNIARHSRASAVQVHLVFADRRVSLQVTDNGVGFDPNSGDGGFGLVSMRERLSQLGGWLEIASTPGEGTRLTAYLPLEEKEALYGKREDQRAPGG